MQVGMINVYDSKVAQFGNKKLDDNHSELKRDEVHRKYVEEFNKIPKKANRFFWIAQLVGTALGALGGYTSMSKGWLSSSAKQAMLIGALGGWFVSFCVGLAKKEGVVEKQNELTQNYMDYIEKA